MHRTFLLCYYRTLSLCCNNLNCCEGNILKNEYRNCIFYAFDMHKNYDILMYGGILMRTTIDINDELLKEVMKLSNVQTKKEAVTISFKSFIRQKKLELLAQRLGKGSLSLTPKDLENMRIR